MDEILKTKLINMEATEILCVAGISLMLGYILACVSRYGIPASISDTFYLLEKDNRNLGYLFTAALWLTSFMILPCWLEATPEAYEFIPFIACGALIGVGIATHFLIRSEKRVHYSCAILWAVASITWMVLKHSWPSLIVPVAAVSAVWVILGMRNTTFWCEFAVVLALASSLIIEMNE